jgi:molybdate transport system substrate-binding protein
MKTRLRSWARAGTVLAIAAACMLPATSAMAATHAPLKVMVAGTTKSLSYSTVSKTGHVVGRVMGYWYYGAPVKAVLAKAGYTASSLTSVRAVDVNGDVVVLTQALLAKSTTLIAYKRTSGPLSANDGAYRLIIKGNSSLSRTKIVKIEANPYELDVSAASSLTAIFKKYAHIFESAYNAHIVFNFNASGTLQKQIEAGAPVDVFCSAAPKQVNALISESLITSGKEQVFASNDLCILVPKGNPGKITQPSDLWTKANMVVTGDPAVAPHGVAAREWLTALGEWSSMLSAGKLVLAPNAAVTDAYISSANVDAGIGFKSDAFGRSDISVVYTVPQSYFTQIKYVVAPINAAKHPSLASLYTTWMTSSYFQKTLKSNGFKAAP